MQINIDTSQEELKQMRFNEAELAEHIQEVYSHVEVDINVNVIVHPEEVLEDLQNKVK